MSLHFILQSLAGGLLIGGIYSLVALGLNLIVGVMGVVSFVHGSLLMLGMYVTYCLFTYFGVDPYLSLVISGPILFAIGIVIQRLFITPIIDAPHSTVLLLTLGLAIILDNITAFFFGHESRMIRLSYGDKTFMACDILFSVPRVIAFGFGLLGTFLLFLFLKRTRMGKAIRAVASQKEGAMIVGINVKRIYLITFGLGSALAGIGGTLILPFFSVSPSVGMGFIIYAFVVMVLGGMGNLMGSLIGGLIIGVCEGLATIFIGPALRQIVSYLIFVLVLLFKPTGLLGREFETD